MTMQKLGPFELIRVLGRGGMGTVYEAREEDREEHVAVKALAPTFSFDEHFRRRFEAEIDALLALDHKNIVRLLAFGQDQGNLYFAMELIDGQSLYQEQKQGHVFHWQEIIEIGIQVCEGLRHAHERGIIHRDLKPGNLMVDSHRDIKIADFGIAKSFGKSSFTSEGNVLGTMDFMAPEQARGNPTDARSDLFSLGAVLYSLLAGKPPFLKKTVEETFEALLSAEPPPRLDSVAPDTPQPLADLIHRLMEKDPQRRIATAMATGRQLAHVLGQIQMNSRKSETEVIGKSQEDFRLQNTECGEHESASRIDLKDSDTSENMTRRVARQKNAGAFKKVPEGATRPDLSEVRKNHPDYFNEVTAQQRKKTTEIGTVDRETGSVWPLLIALLTVITMLVGGVWFALRPPSRDALLLKLRTNENSPTKVQDEIEQFQRWYADDPELAFVNDLQTKAEIERYCNSLRLRARGSGKRPLTETEARFLEYHEISKSDINDALTQMRSLLILSGTSTAKRSDQDNKALGMAERVVLQWAVIAETGIASGTRQIQDGFRSAENSSSKDAARKIYESIIRIYSPQPWASELVKETRQKLETLNQDEDGDLKPDTDQ